MKSVYCKDSKTWLASGSADVRRRDTLTHRYAIFSAFVFRCLIRTLATVKPYKRLRRICQRKKAVSKCHRVVSRSLQAAPLTSGRFRAEGPGGGSLTIFICWKYSQSDHINKMALYVHQWRLIILGQPFAPSCYMSGFSTVTDAVWV